MNLVQDRDNQSKNENLKLKILIFFSWNETYDI